MTHKADRLSSASLIQAQQAIWTHPPVLNKRDSMAAFGVFAILMTGDKWPSCPEEAGRWTSMDPRVMRRYWTHIEAARAELVE